MSQPASAKLRLRDSPFLELDTPFTIYEAFKLIVLLPVAIPRAIIGVCFIALVALINSIAAWNWPVDQPLTPKRRSVILWSKNLLVVVFWCLGFRIRVKGREHLKTGEQLKAVACFNHVAWLDAFIVVWLMAPSGVAKEYNAHLPVIKHAVRALQTVYIPSSKGIRKDAAPDTDGKPTAEQSAKQGDKPLVNAFVVSSSVTEVLQKRVDDPQYCTLGGYPMIVMAPEGTCGNGKCVMEFRSGAFVLGRPILPICLHYKFKHHSPAWTMVHELWHFTRLMTQFVNHLEVTILPPYVPSPAELEAPKLYTENVRALMAKTMGLPLVAANSEQYLLLKKLRLSVSWDGRKVLDPKGVVVDGEIDLGQAEALLAASGRGKDSKPKQA